MFISEEAPALIYGLLALSIPESPRYLVSAGAKTTTPPRVLGDVVGLQEKSDIAAKISEIRRTINLEARQKLRDLFVGGKLMPIVWVGIGLAVFQQFVGINVIFYYSTTLWQAVGIAEEQAMLVQVITTSTNIIATIVGILLVDKVGRRIPLIVGSAVMAAGLLTMALAFSQAVESQVTNDFGDVETAVSLPEPWGVIALIAANVFVIGFGATWGPFMWLMLGEMFLNRIRAVALGLASAFNWGSNFLISFLFPQMAELSLVFAYGFYGISALVEYAVRAQVGPGDQRPRDRGHAGQRLLQVRGARVPGPVSDALLRFSPFCIVKNCCACPTPARTRVEAVQLHGHQPPRAGRGPYGLGTASALT